MPPGETQHVRTCSKFDRTIALAAIAIALAIYSVQLNYQYAIWLFRSLGVWRTTTVRLRRGAADIGKLALPWLINQQWIAGRSLAAAGTTILMIGPSHRIDLGASQPGLQAARASQARHARSLPCSPTSWPSAPILKYN